MLAGTAKPSRRRGLYTRLMRRGGRRKGGRGSKPDDVLAKAMGGVVFPEDDIALGGLSRKELGLPELGFDQGLLQSMQLPVANKKKKQQPPS